MNKQQYALRHVAGTYWIIKTNQQEQVYVPPLMVNESGVIIWRGLEEGLGIDELSRIVQNHYGIDSRVAIEDVQNFLEQLTSSGYMTNSPGE